MAEGQIPANVIIRGANMPLSQAGVWLADSGPSFGYRCPRLSNEFNGAAVLYCVIPCPFDHESTIRLFPAEIKFVAHDEISDLFVRQSVGTFKINFQGINAERRVVRQGEK